jgi:hypothetical protein
VGLDANRDTAHHEPALVGIDGRAVALMLNMSVPRTAAFLILCWVGGFY